MKTIQDMIDKLTALKSEHGNIECMMADETEPSFTLYEDDGEEPVIIVE
jgi:hypothetical protein